jgi:hypothetical protein
MIQFIFLSAGQRGVEPLAPESCEASLATVETRPGASAATGNVLLSSIMVPLAPVLLLLIISSRLVPWQGERHKPDYRVDAGSRSLLRVCRIVWCKKHPGIGAGDLDLLPWAARL